jgi:hypothetical protein
MRDVDLRGFLDDEGYGHQDARNAALDVLRAAGLTRPGKQRMAEAKLPAARDALRRSLLVTCAHVRCQQRAAEDQSRTRVPAATRACCELCGGSDNRHAVEAMMASLRSRGVRRLVVVGGSPGTREELVRLVGDAIDLRTVDGTAPRRGREARDDKEWADLIVVWGSTELAHRVSNHYTTGPRYRASVITVARRGIAALADGIARSTAARPRER